MTDLPRRVSLREVGPRDGLQNEDPVPTGAKIELINALSQTGVSRIEAVSFVRPDAIPQMADADQVWGGIERTPAVRYSALAPNLRGARRALDSGFTEVEAVVSASDTHNRRNVNRGTEESLDDIAVILGEARRVRREIERDPGLVNRPDARSGWTPLHAVCASQWIRLDPARADGLLAVARLLLDAGADPHGRVGRWSPLRQLV